MAHVRQEARLQVGDPPQGLRVLVELGVEGDHAAIGLLQLAGVQLGELGLAVAQLLEGAEQLLVLLLEARRAGPAGPVLRQLGGEPGQLVRGQWGRPLRQALGHRDGGSALRRSDLELVHQPSGAEDADPQAGRRVVPAVEDRLEVLDPRAPLVDADQKARRGRRADQELDPAAARVLEGVAGDLRDRRGDPRLVERGEAQQAGDLAGALPRQDDVGFQADLQGQEGHAHGRLSPRSRATTTVTSSRPRRKSR